MIEDYLNQDAYWVTKANHVLYSGLSVASPVLTGSLPSVTFRVAVTISSTTGHADCAGSAVVGSETLTFAVAGKKTTTMSLSALPAISCSGLDCNILVEAISVGGAPLQTETQTAIKIRKEAYQSGYFNAAGVWTATRDAVYCTAVMAVGDKIRFNGTDYTILKVEDNPGLDGTSEFYTYLVA
jgi:hypothetical protein